MIILLLDTSGPVCRLALCYDRTQPIEWIDWQADRQLARGLLGFIEAQLHAQGYDWSSIEGIGVFRGSGSFTGLRIGITVMNTLADDRQLPIVGETGETWAQTAVQRLRNGDNDRLVLPHYGRSARITQPRK